MVSAGADSVPVFAGLRQGRNDADIIERGGVAFHFAASADFLEQAAHDFAASRLWQGGGEADVIGPGDGSYFFSDVPFQCGDKFGAGVLAGFDGHNQSSWGYASSTCCCS